MVIFKTSVRDKNELAVVEPLLNIIFGKHWAFAFEERLLSVITALPCAEVIRHIFMEKGFYCEEFSGLSN